MPIERLLQQSGLTPAHAARLREAYRSALHQLGLVDRNDPVAEIVAKKVFEIGAAGGEPEEIARTAAKSLGVP